MNYKKVVFIQVLLLLFLTSPGISGKVSYQYDSRKRLEKAVYPDGTVIDYTYDNIGNRLSMRILNPDVDEDGMPDIWEIKHFNTLERDGSGDHDEDGIFDLEEYRNGTEPARTEKSASVHAIPYGESYGKAQEIPLPMDASGSLNSPPDEIIPKTDPPPGSPVSETPLAISPETTLDGSAADSTGMESDTPMESFGIASYLNVTVGTDSGRVLPEIKVHAFTDQGDDTGLRSTTDAQGRGGSYGKNSPGARRSSKRPSTLTAHP